MAVTLYEKVESRNLQVGRDTATLVAELIAVGSNSEAEVYQAAVLDTTVSYFGTLFRSAIDVTPRGGGPYWDVRVTYSPIPPGEAIQAPNLDGGGAPTEQPQAPDPAAPIGPGFSFTTSGGTTRIYQSLKTVSTTRSLEAIAGNIPARDYHGALNVTDDGQVEGTDITSRNGELTVEVRRNNVSMNYFTTLFNLTGTVNNARFYGFAEGEVLYMGAEARYSISDLWQITHKFSLSPNKVNYVVSKDKDGIAQLTVPEKKGWDYIWVGYTKKAVDVGGGVTVVMQRPIQAVVCEVYERNNFAALEIGV